MIREILEDHKIFKRLFKLIDEHPHKEDMTFLHSSILMKGGRVLSVGVNKPSSNSFAKVYALHKGWQLHSEAVAIYQVRKMNLNGAVIYNARLNKLGDVEISRPCEGCSKMLSDFGIKKVVYTTSTGIEVEKVQELKLRKVA